MIPVSALQAKLLSKVEGLAIVIPSGKYDQTFLVADADPTVAILLDGPHAFNAFQSSLAENWKGAVVEGVDIYVDQSSIYSVSSDGVKLGSIVISGDQPNLVANIKEGPWTSVELVPLRRSHNSTAGAHSEKVGFTSWQAILQDGNEKIVVFERSTVEDVED
ncbi:hypothetical protein [Qipengyuania psychrotolerans]|uniref:Uncharacterized protein n=1 Tax=Qipengyuania psychrotolerans TaxID=2867238 RepID=A0ABX8ZAU9_9SPHN|nr:hypothetical protein [Qipengyuania psychrotolerans]QZD86121.1 hypothetical protein K3166_07475 [Qipengyuania psychrotolerans]